jgi:DNA-binding IclR family transcriptional regulator
LSDGRAATVTGIARELRINTSTCFNILRTLASETAVLFDEVSKTYRIGPGVLQFVSNLMSDENRILAAGTMLHQYAREHQVTVCMWRRTSPLRNILVAAENGGGAVRIQIPLGQSLPVLLGSTGRVMAMHLRLSKSEVRAEFEKLRWFNAPRFSEFWRDAVEAYERGWAIDVENFTAGVTTISTPVISSISQISYSLTALAFTGKFDARELELIAKELVELAGKLRSALY